MRKGTTRAFTMIELIVSVGLMVILLGVLAFVFRQSTEAVGSATEAVTVWQTARNFEARLGRELASAVQYVVEQGTQAVRAFVFDDNPGADSGSVTLEFVTQTMKNGELDTWDVRYHYLADDGEDYGAIRRMARKIEYWGKLETSHAYEEQILVWPVRNVTFTAAGDWEATVLEGFDTVDNPELPAYVRVNVTFLDQWGGTSLQVPLEFYFPIYQGN